MSPPELKTLGARQPFPHPSAAPSRGRTRSLPCASRPCPGRPRPRSLRHPRARAPSHGRRQRHETKEPAGRLLFIWCHWLPKADTGHPHKALFTFLRPL